MALLSEWMTQTWNMLLEAAPWLLGGFLLAGVIYVLLPADKVISHLGKPGLAGVVKASLLGIPLPLCSCSVIPVASSIRQRGASRGATASFLISTPETGLDSIAISYALLGPFLAIVRPLAAFLTALIAGCLIEPLKEPASTAHSNDIPVKTSGYGQCCGEDHGPGPSSLAGKIATAVRYGLVDLFADLSHWLVLGFVLGGLVSAMFPARFFEESIGTGLGPMLLMVLAGLPLYVCATSSTPLAAALMAKGLSPGAALVFLLVGPATNVATMVVVARDLGRRSLFIYLSSIVVVAVLFGLGTDAVLRSSTPAGDVAGGVGHSESAIISWLSAVGLVLLMLNGMRIRVRALRTAS